MENFVFHNPTKLVFGKDTVEKIGEELRKNGIKKVLMIYGGGSIKKNGVYEKVVRSLHDNGITKVELSGIRPNPVLSKVHEAIAVAKKEQVEAILAVGGGSVVDSGKAIAAGYYYEGDIWDAFIGKYAVKKALPLYVVLTMSATGTEMNGNGVITNEETLEKLGFGSKYVYPVVSIVDPTVQYSLPRDQVVYGAIDAISHVMEHYFDVAGSALIDSIDEGIIRTIMSATEKVIEEPENYEARANLCLATTLALNGLTKMGTTGGDWSSHDLQHPLSALKPEVAHGAGLAVVFPAWMTYVRDLISEKLIKFGKNILNLGDDATAERTIDELRRWYKSVGAPITLKELGFTQEDVQKVTQIASKHAPLGKVKRLDTHDIESIYRIAYEF
ncbi:MAG TPA: iron-containing alcohol dehydrogenase [Fervidobacterium sp.]|nr:iron-containing alcohol dehydrogenase [Fervidobacterium sp.]HOA16343.1 iron-containing alcohol dehydrogenase [Fervidobacterium sp.]HOH53861.1 iron-containing alcohol dehydrogenase [Fervidobacterium sp.]HOK33511.1 iron-containing alcohol dehydrogenase [Fervidobacterium sp.]HOL03428.1 iron-containing alcohol dehydrogenase [Fervidobacterium sp.]